MDFTHLRFFSLRDMIDMLESVGFELDVSVAPPVPAFDSLGQHIYKENVARLPASIAFGDISINIRSTQALVDICAYQYTITAQLRPDAIAVGPDR